MSALCTRSDSINVRSLKIKKFENTVVNTTILLWILRRFNLPWFQYITHARSCVSKRIPEKGRA